MTLALFSKTIAGTYEFFGTAFDSAFEDIKVLYPSLNLQQHLIKSTNYNIDTCGDWNDNVERLTSAVYYLLNSFEPLLADRTEAERVPSVQALINGGQRISHFSFSCI
ncbi:hypothetical protein RvY_02399 [Ramazzottius varieornatus]|uniref:Uncharacterized protein n=1 Tax=Ramazzottius varieornatus TaxID=947166 RepID=A0A1D1UJJ7_RAMVA|nr:hypothetical protein RvY_02399 [Ramazzottius varieornatus]